ncbi:MAG: uroporphyrinogen decarboxylase family protein [Actinomycetota bacterium]|nr:uroporphyrinogen decarboxylase family protein [Actinomycetota bacterium]
MNSREKFYSVLDGNNKEINMKTEFAYWAGTIKQWLKEGLPQKALIAEDITDSESLRGSKPLSDQYVKKVDLNVMDYFKLDSYLEKFPFDLSPMLETEVIEENSNYKIFTDNFGIKQKIYKHNSSIPLILEYPIKSREEFENYKLFYDKDFKKRLPADFDNLSISLNKRDFPIRLGGNPFGFSFLARHLMGDYTYMINLYDNPDFIKDFNDFFLEYVMEYFSVILQKIQVDCIFIIEDVAYRSGSFISPEMFKEFLSPNYIRFIDYLKQFNIKNIFVDCDGKINELIPLWINVGVNGLFPLEAVNDIEKIREDFPYLRLMGGFNKKVLFKDSDKTEIDKELEKTYRMIKKGRYIPHIDHAVSPDVTWQNFKYYRTRLNDFIDSL